MAISAADWEYLINGDFQGYNDSLPKLSPEAARREQDRADYRKACEILRKKELDDKRIMNSHVPRLWG